MPNVLDVHEVLIRYRVDDQSTFKRQAAATKKSIKDIGKESKKTSDAIDRLASLSAIGHLKQFTFYMQQFVTTMISARQEAERLMISYEVFLGSADRAAQVFQRIRQFAVRTPYAFPEVQRAASLLLAFSPEARKDPNQLVRMLSAAGGGAAAMGGKPGSFEDIARVLGRIRAGQLGFGLGARGLGRFGITPEDLRRGGLPSYHLGAGGTAGIDPAQALEAAIRALETKFPDLMARLAQTIGGQIENLTDELRELVREMGGGAATAAGLFVTPARGAVQALNAMPPAITKTIGFMTLIGMEFAVLSVAAAGAAIAMEQVAAQGLGRRFGVPLGIAAGATIGHLAGAAVGGAVGRRYGEAEADRLGLTGIEKEMHIQSRAGQISMYVGGAGALAGAGYGGYRGLMRGTRQMDPLMTGDWAGPMQPGRLMRGTRVWSEAPRYGITPTMQPSEAGRMWAEPYLTRGPVKGVEAFGAGPGRLMASREPVGRLGKLRRFMGRVAQRSPRLAQGARFLGRVSPWVAAAEGAYGIYGAGREGYEDPYGAEFQEGMTPWEKFGRGVEYTPFGGFGVKPAVRFAMRRVGRVGALPADEEVEEGVNKLIQKRVQYYDKLRAAVRAYKEEVGGAAEIEADLALARETGAPPEELRGGYRRALMAARRGARTARRGAVEATGAWGLALRDREEYLKRQAAAIKEVNAARRKLTLAVYEYGENEKEVMERSIALADISIGRAVLEERSAAEVNAEIDKKIRLLEKLQTLETDRVERAKRQLEIAEQEAQKIKNTNEELRERLEIEALRSQTGQLGRFIKGKGGGFISAPGAVENTLEFQREQISKNIINMEKELNQLDLTEIERAQRRNQLAQEYIRLMRTDLSIQEKRNEEAEEAARLKREELQAAQDLRYAIAAIGPRRRFAWGAAGPGGGQPAYQRQQLVGALTAAEQYLDDVGRRSITGYRTVRAGEHPEWSAEKRAQVEKMRRDRGMAPYPTKRVPIYEDPDQARVMEAEEGVFQAKLGLRQHDTSERERRAREKEKREQEEERERDKRKRESARPWYAGAMTATFGGPADPRRMISQLEMARHGIRISAGPSRYLGKIEVEIRAADDLLQSFGEGPLVEWLAQQLPIFINRGAGGTGGGVR